jgi:hypothetical protein
MTRPARIVVSCAAAVCAILLSACAGVELDPFGRPYADGSEFNYPAGREFCNSPNVDVQAYFLRGNDPLPPVENAFVARNAVAKVKYHVDTAGKVKVLKVDSVDKAFADHAIIAVNDWKFKPAMRGGVPVDAECTVVLGYSWQGFEDKPPGQTNR